MNKNPKLAPGLATDLNHLKLQAYFWPLSTNASLKNKES